MGWTFSKKGLMDCTFLTYGVWAVQVTDAFFVLGTGFTFFFRGSRVHFCGLICLIGLLHSVTPGLESATRRSSTTKPVNFNNKISKVTVLFRPILLFTNTDVYITKICLDTSILVKSIMDRLTFLSRSEFSCHPSTPKLSRRPQERSYGNAISVC
jgi:hypothetical protein